MLIMEEVAWWERIKQRREELGLSTYAVAKATKLSRGAIVNIESGGVKEPRAETIQAIADVLGMSIDELAGGIGPLARASIEIEVFTLLRGIDPDLHGVLEQIAREAIEKRRQKRNANNKRGSGGDEPTGTP